MGRARVVRGGPARRGARGPRHRDAPPVQRHPARGSRRAQRGFSTCVTVDYRGGRAAGPSSAKKTTHDTRARARAPHRRPRDAPGASSTRSTPRPANPNPDANATSAEPTRATNTPTTSNRPTRTTKTKRRRRVFHQQQRHRAARASTILRPPLSPTIPNRGVPPPVAARVRSPSLRAAPRTRAAPPRGLVTSPIRCRRRRDRTRDRSDARARTVAS